MYHDHLQAVKATLTEARARRDLQAMGDEMLQIFLTQYPEATATFEGFELDYIARHKFCKVADALVDVLEYPDYSGTSLSEEVSRHQIYDVQDREYYFALVDALVTVVKSSLGDDWDEKTEESWADTVSGFRHNIDLAFRENFDR
jgi:Globin